MSRREFTEAVKAEIRARAGGVCECHLMPADILHMFPKDCTRKPVAIDHVYADTLEDEADKSVPLTADEGAHRAQVSKLRKKLPDWARPMSVQGVGVRLLPDAKARIKAMLKEAAA